jgi:hypothetical protein
MGISPAEFLPVLALQMSDADLHCLFFLKSDLLIFLFGQDPEIGRSPFSGSMAYENSKRIPRDMAIERNTKVTSLPVLDGLGKPIQ